MRKNDIKNKSFSIFKLVIIILIVFMLFLTFVLKSQMIHSTNLKKNIIYNQDSEIIIFEDNFNEKNVDNWHWRVDGNGYNIVENGIANFTIFDNATSNEYSNSEIYDHYNPEGYPYYRNSIHFRLKNTALVNGSRGWGFWNGNMNPTQSVMAWFTRLKGNETYQNNGFYGVVQSLGQMPTQINLTDYENTLLDWANYSIDWTENFCAFSINDEIVANITENLPNDHCRIDVWVDNAVYSENWEHIYQTIEQDCSLLLDWVKVNQSGISEVVPEPPNLITESQTIESNNITIEWNVVDNAEYYNVYVNRTLNETTNENTQMIILDENYEITVTAVNGTRESNHSNPITIIVNNIPTSSTNSVEFKVAFLLSISFLVIVVLKKKIQ